MEYSVTSVGPRTKDQLWSEVKILGAAVFVCYMLPPTKPFSSTDTYADHVVYDHSALAPHRSPTQCPWSQSLHRFRPDRAERAREQLLDFF